MKVYGTVRVDDWNRETRVARALVIESLDSIERGVHVGPVARRFDRVAPRPAQTEVLARVLDTIYPSVYISQGQVVFIDKGKDDGLLPGNRLRVFRRGDIWRRRLKLSSEYADDRVILDSPKPTEMRNIPSQDDEEFPDEIIGEVLVLRVEESSAVAVVTRSDGELKQGDRMIATVGY
ncbi:MAG: hypothetical protein MK135_16940 [Polyangiaceae bacterium]|nr:hypothetical protein [Polyangiaceae bacterium]